MELLALAMRPSSSAGCLVLVAVSDLASQNIYGSGQGLIIMQKSTELRSETEKGWETEESRRLSENVKERWEEAKGSHKVKKMMA